MILTFNFVKIVLLIHFVLHTHFRVLLQYPFRLPFSPQLCSVLLISVQNIPKMGTLNKLILSLVGYSFLAICQANIFIYQLQEAALDAVDLNWEERVNWRSGGS